MLEYITIGHHYFCSKWHTCYDSLTPANYKVWHVPIMSVLQAAYSALKFRMNLNKANQVILPTTNTSSNCRTSKDFMLPLSSLIIMLPIWWLYFQMPRWECLKQAHFTILYLYNPCWNWGSQYLSYGTHVGARLSSKKCQFCKLLVWPSRDLNSR